MLFKFATLSLLGEPAIKAKGEKALILYLTAGDPDLETTENLILALDGAGVDGVLVVDLPPEEVDELRTFTDPQGIDFITLTAPTTDDRRLEKIVRTSSGFIYYISVTGVTGTKKPDPEAVARDLRRIGKATDLPVAVGFGISTAAQVRKFAALANGVVIGSAFVKWITQHGQEKDFLPQAAAYARELKEATIL
ncbi:MAG: tryptophan synthase subunit alpha [Syntrophus sp. (in: bacteria)]